MVPAADLHASVQPNPMREPYSGIKRDRPVIAFNRRFEFPQFTQDIAAIEVGVGIVGFNLYGSLVAGERRACSVQRLLPSTPVTVSLRIVGLDCNGPLVAYKSVLQVTELGKGKSHVHMRDAGKFVLRVGIDRLAEEFQCFPWVVS